MSLADEYGEEPARFLARPVPSSLGTIEARIRGLQSTEEIEQWVRCERAIGTRRPVLKALAKRREELETGQAESESEVAADA
jgi:hypothetical protein